ncbi:protein HIR1 [Kwoniella heveanensis BCC8398]|uniref:Protein HIR n=1 Tax=Kwoniella heveanensis BCC8398 TaxID=1296120 RepID=A0A1B9GMV2_9TREE|nr:protein HIR1 [Kwoniella heveanensis BCC8398]
MRVTKPAWVAHNAGEKKARCPIYSISVHPDGTRLATGGLVDHKVKIWSTLPILDSEAEQDEANHKLLCTMAAHTGPVLAVRWAHHGRYLATGSDDQVVMIWGIDPAGGGRLWGSEEENYENWKALTRLAGHAADVVDLAWSRDDSMLASVGLDSKVCIWDGQSFRRLRELDLHQGFVKGVCWDPVGNFLATQSDDKTVKVWNTEDWSLVQSVSKPFETSPQNTFFRRLSWSPDGAFIAASNAMNGPVFVAAVIEREGWASDISFVGHENTIQVAAFNPRLFFRKEDEPGRATASCMLALGANDFSISIWRNTLHKPLAVLKNVFTNDLLDLCWSNDGYQLYGSSADGSIVAISFTPDEFPELGAPEATDKVLSEYEYHPKYQRAGSVNPVSATASMANGFGPASTPSTVVNILQPRKGKDKSRRINLSNGQNPSRSLQAPSADPFSAPIQGFANASTAQASTARMFEDAHNAFSHGQNGESSSSPRAGLKRKAVLFSDDEGRAVRGRIMGSTQNGQSAPVEILRAPKLSIASGSYTTAGSATLPVPQIQSLIRASMLAEEGNGYLEAQNSSSASGVNKLVFARDDSHQWVNYLPSAILALAVTSTFCAAACEDGSVHVYTVAGRQLSSLRLPAVVHDIQGCNTKLLIITVDAQVRVIDTRKGSVVVHPTSLAHLLQSPATSSGAALEIKECALRPNGVPIIVTTEPAAYAYDRALAEWIVISAPWWFESSPLSSNSVGPMGSVDRTVRSMWKGKKRDAVGEWWDEALAMGHYESRIKACILLDSDEEYQDWLIQYVRYLGNEGFLERAEEVIQELMGPIHSFAAAVKWEAKIVGLDKRAVAQEVVETLSRTKSGQELAKEYGTTLKRIADDERWS